MTDLLYLKRKFNFYKDFMDIFTCSIWVDMYWMCNLVPIHYNDTRWKAGGKK